jgi:hypothetical protein
MAQSVQRLGYEADDREIEVRLLAGASFFFSP